MFHPDPFRSVLTSEKMATYEDSYCSIGADGVVIIKKYYFPFATSKKIRVEDIRDIQIVDTNGILGTKYWGMAADTVWWACGNKWCSGSKKLIIITTDSCMKKGFACEDGQAFRQAYADICQNQLTSLVNNPVVGKPASSDEKGD